MYTQIHVRIYRVRLIRPLYKNFHCLQNGVIVLYEIFGDYWGENMLEMEQVCGILRKACVSGATFGFQCVIFK